MRVTCRDGEFKNVTATGTIIGDYYLAVFFDITDLKKTEEALRESEEQFRAMSEYSHHAIMIVDEKARIIWVNPKALELTGYDADKLGRADSFLDFVAPESMDFVRENLPAVPGRRAIRSPLPVPDNPVRWGKNGLLKKA